MSAYEDYDSAAPAYDRTRAPVGADIVADGLRRGPWALDRIALLDAGCGTGNYTEALAPLVASVDAVDLSAGMLETARAKLAGTPAGCAVRLCRAGIDRLPYAGDAFQGVMVNQVLHHLEDGSDPWYPVHRRVLAEFARVLAPGGVLTVNTCTRDQLERGFWYYDLIPRCRDDMIRRHMPLENLVDALGEHGVRVLECRVPAEATMQGTAGLDPRGPLDPAWRRGDSIWARASDAEVAAAVERIRTLEREGRLEDWVAERDATRRIVGQLTFCIAQKTA